MTTYYMVETNTFNLANKHERFVCCDEFLARAVLNMIISVEYTDYDNKQELSANDETFISGWRFWDKNQHPSAGDWVTLRKYEIESDE